MSAQDDPDGPHGATLAAGKLREMGSGHRQYQTDDQGKRLAIVPPIPEYEELLADLHDLAVVAERHDLRRHTGQADRLLGQTTLVGVGGFPTPTHR